MKRSVAALGLAGAALLGGCSTMFSNRSTAVVVMVKEGVTYLPSKAESKAARAAMAGTLAERNLRLVDSSGDAEFVATVDVRESRDGKYLEPVAIRTVTVNRLRSFQRSASENYGRRPLIAESVHPSIRLTEQNQQLEQWKGSRVP